MTTATLPAHVVERLSTTGVTAGWVGDQIGMGNRQAAKVLKDLGYHQVHGRWCLRSILGKPKTYGNDRACVAATFTASDFRDGGRE